MNATGQRRCERRVGQRYGRFKVSANSTNLASPRRAGVHLREALERTGWYYDDGITGPQTMGRVVSECYPYTTIVGAVELVAPPIMGFHMFGHTLARAVIAPTTYET